MHVWTVIISDLILILSIYNIRFYELQDSRSCYAMSSQILSVVAIVFLDKHF